ncbi:MAG: HD domain-containing phosphohydrolase [Betaproteobacteria bacterium]
MVAACSILIVDDYEPNLRGLGELLTAAGYQVSLATNGLDALRIVADDRPDCILLDVVLPGGLSGVEICAKIKSNPASALTPVILISASTERGTRLAGLEAGADDFLDKPIDTGELYTRVRALLRIKRLTDDLESAEAVFLSLGRVIELRDPCTNGHCERLAHYAIALGDKLGLGKDDLDALYRGAFLHDIGKIGIPDRVLLKRGRLTRRQFDVMKRHPVIGEELCRTIRSLEHVRPIVRHHHERIDGRGYPDGLRGADVPLVARIVSVVDIFDALTTDRPYRPALPVATAYRMLVEHASEGGCDPELVDAFVALHRAGGLLPAGPDRRQPAVTPAPLAARAIAQLRVDHRVAAWHGR